MTNNLEQRTRRALGTIGASVNNAAPPFDAFVNQAARRTRTHRTRTLIGGLLVASLSGGIAAAVVLRTHPTRELLVSGTTVDGLHVAISEFKQTLPDPSHPRRSHPVSGLCIDVFGSQGAGPACFNYDVISKGPQAKVFKNNKATVDGVAHLFIVSFVTFEVPPQGLSKATITAANQPDITLDYFVDNTRHLVFALTFSDIPRGAGLTTVGPNNAVRDSPLDIVRFPK